MAKIQKAWAKQVDQMDTWYHGKSKEERTKEKAREWQRQIRGELRRLDRDINRIRQEEAKLKREIEANAKKGNSASVRTLATQVVRSRKAVSRFERVKCSLSAVNLNLTTAIGTMAMGTSLKMSAKAMKEMNRLTDVPELQQTMQAMRKEVAMADIKDEMIEESFANSDDEDEVETEVARVLDELHLDTAQLMAAPARIDIPTRVSASAPETLAGGDAILLDRLQTLKAQ